MVSERGAANRGRKAGEKDGEAIGSGSGAGGGGAPEDIDSDSAAGGGADVTPKADAAHPNEGADAPSHGSR